MARIRADGLGDGRREDARTHARTHARRARRRGRTSGSSSRRGPRRPRRSAARRPGGATAPPPPPRPEARRAPAGRPEPERAVPGEPYPRPARAEPQGGRGGQGPWSGRARGLGARLPAPSPVPASSPPPCTGPGGRGAPRCPAVPAGQGGRAPARPVLPAICGLEGLHQSAGQPRRDVGGGPPSVRGARGTQGRAPAGENQRLLPRERGPAGQVQQPGLVSGLQKVFYPNSYKFSRQVAVGGMFQNNTLNVYMEKSIVTGPDNYITSYDRLNFHRSYRVCRPSFCD